MSLYEPIQYYAEHYGILWYWAQTNIFVVVLFAWYKNLCSEVHEKGLFYPVNLLRIGFALIAGAFLVNSITWGLVASYALAGWWEAAEVLEEFAYFARFFVRMFAVVGGIVMFAGITESKKSLTLASMSVVITVLLTLAWMQFLPTVEEVY